MNISSIVVLVKPEKEAELVALFKESEFCEYHLNSGDGKIIVTVEGESIEDEMAALNKIKTTPGVISAEMAFAYSEDELEKQRDKLETSAEFPEWLNNDDVDARQIKYNGDLRRKL